MGRSLIISINLQQNCGEKKDTNCQIKKKQGRAWENGSSSKELTQRAGGPESGPLAPREKPGVCNSSERRWGHEDHFDSDTMDLLDRLKAQSLGFQKPIPRSR